MKKFNENELIGMKWGTLDKDLQKELLENATCINGEACNEIDNGECIVDLTENLSVSGKVMEYEIIIDNNSIIYDPSEGII